MRGGALNDSNFLTFSKCGRKLAELHLHYPGVEVTGDESGNLRVQMMKFVTKGGKSRIQYDAFITILNIPAKACEYVIGDKSSIEWMMDGTLCHQLR